MILKSKFYAFTLAEVLITLVIIGVIAAITVPAMIQQTQKQEYVAGLKKAQSILANSLYLIANNNGYPHGDYTFFNNEHFIDEFEKVANVIKKCNTTAECFAGKLNTAYKRLSGQAATSGISSGKSVIVSDGQMYTFINVTKNDSLYGLSDDDKNNVLGRIVVDLNGWKKPNQYGYDTFLFYIVNDKGLVPAGSYSTNNCTKSGHGADCAAKVLKENKISY